MKGKVFNKILASVLALFMMLSYVGLYANVSNAKTVEHWMDRVFVFDSGYAYPMNEYDTVNHTDMTIGGTKFLFYDTTGEYENLTCIRTGASHAETYEEVDFYKLKELAPESFNDLFKTDSKGTADEKYNHVLWEIENFYLFSNSDTNEDKERRLAAYNEFIDASELPYDSSSTIEVELQKTKVGNNVGSNITFTKNEMLIKTLQNELLMRVVNQFFDRKSDLTNVSEWNGSSFNALDASKQAYVNKIVTKFENMNASKAAGNIAENHQEYGSKKITIASSNDGSDSTNNISGKFTVTNPYPGKLAVSKVTIKIDGNEVTDYTVLNEQGNTENNLIEKLTNNAEYKFRIQAAGLGTKKVDVIVDFDYGDIIDAVLLVPQGSNKNGYDGSCQYLININKYHKKDSAESSATATPKYFDLALTKQITNVSLNEEETYSYDRLKDIIVKPLQTNGTTANYYMDKSVVRVSDGCKVTYKITIYNEGQIDGYAKKITDYLPEGIDFIDPSESTINNEYGWHKVDGNSKVIATEYLANNKLNAFDGTTLGNQDNNYVELELKVNAENVEPNTVLDNRAEISDYGYMADDGTGNLQYVQANNEGIDRDSKQNSVLEDADVNNVADLIEKIEEIVSERAVNIQYIEKNTLSYEDDDDIERVILKRDITFMDIALRKWISNVDGTDYDRAPTINSAENNDDYFNFERPDLTFAMRAMIDGTLTYDNPKQAIEVKPGSLVTYTLGIYNEGTKDAYAEKITDYLPKELEFVEGNAINEQYGWHATKNADGTTTVETEYLAKKNEREANENKLSTLLRVATLIQGQRPVDIPAYREIKIVCKVAENATIDKYLTNRAEITKYGYYTEEDDLSSFVECNEEDVDRDSEEGTVNTNEDPLNLDTWYEEHGKEEIPGTPRAMVPGVQDDDDFETVVVKVTNGDYTVQIKKVSAEDETKTIEGAKFSVKAATSTETKETQPTSANGLTTLLNKVTMDKVGKDNYTITETYVPDPYTPYNGEIKLEVGKKLENGTYVLDKANTKVEGKNVKLDVNGNVITIIVPNTEREFDLSLRKFISAVNGEALEGEESREPQVDLSTLINGDETKNGEKTAKYTHTKEPKLVNPKDIVEYTLRIYNEGEVDGYATRIIDDVPEGVVMVAPEFDEDGKPANKNAEYRWVMYKEMSEEERNSTESNNKSVLKYADKYYVETDKAEEAVLISTDYLSMENGVTLKTEKDTENPNLLKAFDGEKLDYRDIKVEFKVNVAKDNKTIITNYAQISENHGKDGNVVVDRDSTPNEWKDGEDDQDIEKIHVNWFDLALYKWVSSTIVTEDGKTKEYASGHTQDDKSKIVNVTIAKDKLNKTVVKFKWTIKVENQSPIPGYATEIKDHVPAGLKFVEEDNKAYGWKLQEDGTITTDYLKGTLLKENETAEVTVILTWVNNANNLGVKTNYAEISEDDNEFDSPDIDSTPDNFKGKPAEDDEDVDEVRLNVRTGMGLFAEYVAVATGFLVIIALGGIIVKKSVLDKEL